MGLVSRGWSLSRRRPQPRKPGATGSSVFPNTRLSITRAIPFTEELTPLLGIVGTEPALLGVKNRFPRIEGLFYIDFHGVELGHIQHIPIGFPLCVQCGHEMRPEKCWTIHLPVLLPPLIDLTGGIHKEPPQHAPLPFNCAIEGIEGPIGILEVITRSLAGFILLSLKDIVIRRNGTLGGAFLHLFSGGELVVQVLKVDGFITIHFTSPV